MAQSPGSRPIQYRPNVVEVAERLGVDRTTITRWITRGVTPARRSGLGSKRVRLSATRMPSGWVVSDQDLEAFQRDLTAAWIEPSRAETLQTSGERSRQLEQDIAELRRLGLYSNPKPSK